MPFTNTDEKCIEYEELIQELVNTLNTIRRSAGERLMNSVDPLAMEVRIKTGNVMINASRKGFKPTN